MARYTQSLAKKGSQKWIQKLVNEKTRNSELANKKESESARR